MKFNLLLWSLLTLAVLAQAATPHFDQKSETIEPNLKWGKPTDQELQMTEYAADKDAEAVVLYHKTDVSYQFISNDFKV